MDKVLLIFGTRPELIKIAPLVKEFEQCGCREQLVIVNTGQHRELISRSLALLNIQADYTLDLMVPGQSLSELTARALTQLQQLLGILKENNSCPRIILAQGDTATAVAASMVAFYNNIPFGHIEAGLRTNDYVNPFPEEYYRRVISLTASVYYAPTALAQTNLLKENVSRDKIMITGNTIVDALDMIGGLIKKDPAAFSTPVVEQLKQLDNIVLITCHRRENMGANLQHIIEAVRLLARAHSDHHFVWVKHLNPGVRRVVEEAKLGDLPNLSLIEPLDYWELVQLYPRIRSIITDSGGIQEEAPSFGIPVIVMREVTERQESVDLGYATLVGGDSNKIINAFGEFEANKLKFAFNPYGDGKAAKRIADHLLRSAEQDLAEGLSA